jgi:hypothetical protein
MEYRSELEILGLPLVHVAVGGLARRGYRRGVATGWIAVGDIAIGVVFSCGGVAAGGISLGGVSLGGLAVGGLACGLTALGGLAIGLLALGGAAFAWYAAVGGLAVAHDYALGGAAFGKTGNSPLAALLQREPPPQAPFRASDALWLIGVLAVLLIVARLIHERARGSD